MSAEQQQDSPAKATTPSSGNNVVDPHNLQELTQFIQNLLQQTQERFLNMSDQIIKRIDEMGRRIDDLEKNINELMTQANIEEAPTQNQP